MDRGFNTIVQLLRDPDNDDDFEMYFVNQELAEEYAQLCSTEDGQGQITWKEDGSGWVELNRDEPDNSPYPWRMWQIWGIEVHEEIPPMYDDAFPGLGSGEPDYDLDDDPVQPLGDHREKVTSFHEILHANLFCFIGFTESKWYKVELIVGYPEPPQVRVVADYSTAPSEMSEERFVFMVDWDRVAHLSSFVPESSA